MTDTEILDYLQARKDKAVNLSFSVYDVQIGDLAFTVSPKRTLRESIIDAIESQAGALVARKFEEGIDGEAPTVPRTYRR